MSREINYMTVLCFQKINVNNVKEYLTKQNIQWVDVLKDVNASCHTHAFIDINDERHVAYLLLKYNCFISNDIIDILYKNNGKSLTLINKLCILKK